MFVFRACKVQKHYIIIRCIIDLKKNIVLLSTIKEFLLFFIYLFFFFIEKNRKRQNKINKKTERVVLTTFKRRKLMCLMHARRWRGLCHSTAEPITLHIAHTLWVAIGVSGLGAVGWRARDLWSHLYSIESFGPRVEYYKYICVRIFFFLRSTRTMHI